MSDWPPYAPERTHVVAFGSIVQQFARHEYLIQAIIAKLIGASYPNTALITSDLGYAGKRNAILSLLKVIDIKDKTRERIAWHLGELHKQNQLRNHIAHSLWTTGTRLNSIKPLGADARGGQAKFNGLDEDDRDYTIDEFIDIADELSENYDRFVSFLNSVKLLTPLPIAENIEHRSSPTSSSEGTPSDK